MTNAEYVQSVRERNGVTVQAIDGERFPAIADMEGPFRYRTGHVLYYDPREGAYYDRTRDLYLSVDEANAIVLDIRS